MSKRFRTVADVVRWRLCLGCGACAYICPEQKVRLVDIVEEGIRPVLANELCASCTLCLDVCPAYENDRTILNNRFGGVPELKTKCGTVLDIWEGHAADPEIRYKGSSGGLITALSAYCLEKARMHGVLHIGSDPTYPSRNRTFLSRSRSDILSRAGSRYAPASACDRLDLIESAPVPCVFVGQPSEVTALRKAQKLRPQLDSRVGLALSFFCAGSPSTAGTLELLRSKGIDSAQVAELRYRGNGWPGHFSVTLKGQPMPALQMTYEDSWGFVQAYRPFSVHLCPDGTGEDADISCGDPWYRQVRDGEPGSSVVLVRTERGREIIRGAMEAGYVQLGPATARKLLDSQPNLLAKRGAIGGRVAALRVFGVPAPKLKGFRLFKNWLCLPLGDKFRSTFGTVRRILTRRYYRPIQRLRRL
jgi:coenzyme F420 hydrogenase subunit beta